MKVSQFVYDYLCFSDQTQNTENFTNSGTFIMCTLNKCLLFPICIFILVSSLILSSDALDTINVTQTITDGDTIVSSAGSFELGFFSPGNSKNRYVGIWYKTIDVTTPIWVANRETPLTDSLGTLKIIKPGQLVILNGTNQVIWYSSNVSSFVQNPVAQLLDSGNLVIKNEGEENPGNFIWKSFDYPGNTIIAGMKMGKNFETGHEWKLTSWKSAHDPSPGDYTYRIDTHGFPQLIMWKGVNESFRVGPWIGDRFSGQPELKENIVFQYKFMFSKEEVNFSVGVLSSPLPRTVLNPDGVMKWWTWPDQRTGWVTYSSGPPSDSCDNYATCGPYGRCNVDINPFCVCLDKFVTKYPRNYDAGDWSSGCVRRTPLDCEKGDTFLKYSGMKLPDTRMARFNTSMSLEECRVMCLGNCSCMAYSNMNFTEGGSGCFLWFSELMDLRSLVDGQDVYIRMASSEAEAMAKIKNENNREKIILSLTLTIGVLLLFLGPILYLRKMKRRLKVKEEISETCTHCPVEGQREELSLSLFDLATILKACNNFSVSNKLGEGGYGPVYMGVLDGGREIAVKSLSKESSQGLNEFKNEVVFIAKLQHRNLVKLLGCCIEGEEKMLIYEYMPNKSLDSFIFDKTKCTLLDWPKRFNIINGISRGLLYLHQDSRFSIIHRDLKTENILLDTDMNPKISDFGMARSFQGDESEAKTRRLAGTYGYMSPEYAIHGIFSVKSDVFSFGVMVLEIISGKRNRGFSHPDHHLNLLGHAWILHMEGKSLELVDASMINACHSSEILRSIHVALLCVQHYRSDRPTMASVVVMLTSDIALAQPKRPGFFTEDDCLEAECVTSEKRPSSLNEISFTELNAR